MKVIPFEEKYRQDFINFNMDFRDAPAAHQRGFLPPSQCRIGVSSGIFRPSSWPSPFMQGATGRAFSCQAFHIPARWR